MLIIQKVALIFTIIGGIIWGIIGIFDFNVITFIFQSNSIPARIIYSFVGVCALFNLGLLFIRYRHHDYSV